MKFLIIQTAFIGDVILASSVCEKLHSFFPESQIDFLVKKGNESLFDGHPFLNRILAFDKSKSKLGNLLKLLLEIRKAGYTHVINLHRFASTGLLTGFSGAEHRIGFDKNPFSFLYTRKFPHNFGTKDDPVHEVDRDLSLIEHLTDSSFQMPRLHPRKEDFSKIKTGISYVCIAPASMWTTKQYPAEKWMTLINKLPADTEVYLIGGPDDFSLCEDLMQNSGREGIHNLAGQLSFLESAALMAKAKMNFVNDSAPTHLASSVNAPVLTIYCSTLPEFGFTPLSENSRVAETKQKLDCRPCGVHGKKACPLGHFKCSDFGIDIGFYFAKD